MSWFKRYGLIVLSIILFGFAFGFLVYVAITGVLAVSNDIIVVLLTATFGGFGWVVKGEYDKKREIERREHESAMENERLTFETRRQSYEGILQPFIDALAGGVANINEAALREEFMRAGFKLLIYGSDDIIQRFNEYRLLGLEQPPNQNALLVGFARLIISIRKSTGFPDSNLTEETILRTFINNYNEVSEEIQAYIRDHPFNV